MEVNISRTARAADSGLSALGGVAPAIRRLGSSVIDLNHNGSRDGPQLPGGQELLTSECADEKSLPQRTRGHGGKTRAFLLLLYSISAMDKPGGGVLAGDLGQSVGNGGFQTFHGAGLGRTELLFD